MKVGKSLMNNSKLVRSCLGAEADEGTAVGV